MVARDTETTARADQVVTRDEETGVPPVTCTSQVVALDAETDAATFQVVPREDDTEVVPLGNTSTLKRSPAGSSHRSAPPRGSVSARSRGPV